MRSLFVMDPLERINVRGDSTYVTMRECSDRGLPTWMCTPDRLYARDGRTRALVTPVRTTADAPYFHVEAPVDLDLGDFDVVWMRKDPPFDMTYIFTTYLLDMAPPSTLVVNGPRGLKLFNEKMWVQQQWPDLQPPTLLTNDVERIKRFVREQPGRSVIKPWDGNGGRGVVVTDAEDRNLPSLAELLTQDGRTYAITQAYVPEVVDGDKRILLFDGEPVGAMLRVPHAADHRANMHAGGATIACELTATDRAICDAIAPALREWGMVFVGIDVIGTVLTEINVTSPTGIREMNRLYGTRLESNLVDRVMERADARRRSA
ncbi:MAG: glutathione synthase [Alphaproteobacteria bacterium]|nr:glutathione synthase [Alphaproteobacteria bacterium]